MITSAVIEVCPRERGERQHVGFGLVHHGGDLREAAGWESRDGVPLGAAALPGRSGELLCDSFESGVGIGDDQVNPGQAAGIGAGQKLANTYRSWVWLTGADAGDLGLGEPQSTPRAATRSSTLRVETPCT